jgi:hypothetical protein
MPEMQTISPTVSHSSDDLHPSANSNSTADDEVTTPPTSPPGASGPSSWITLDPKSGRTVYNFPSLNKKSKVKANPYANTTCRKSKPTEADWSQHFNSPSLNKKTQAKLADQDPVHFSSSIPRMDFSLSMISNSPPMEPTNAYDAATSPYTKPGATLAVIGMRREKSKPATSPSSSSIKASATSPGKVTSSTERPQVSMPKSQPLSRALFTKLTENTPGPDSIKKSSKAQKLIVPGKDYKTVFELPLTSSEFGRRL